MTIDLEAERSELLRIHADDHQAHVQTDADWLMAHQGEPFVTVSNGRIDELSREMVSGFFKRYFEGATYDEYADLEPPRVEISSDASLAWIISRTRVRRRTRQADGSQVETQFVYAGIMGYARRDGRWQRIANVSTFEPASHAAAA